MIKRPIIHTQIDAILYFFQKMDAEMISTLLDDSRTYQDFAKALFINKLTDLFYEFSALGDTSLHMEKGECYGCSCGVSGYTFVGDKSYAYIDIVFVVDEDGQINDIYECGEFFNKRMRTPKNHRLYLDRHIDFDLDHGEDDDYWKGNDPSFGDDDLPF